MAPNSLSPAFLRMNYSSPFGIHTMTIPTVPYLPPGSPGASADSGSWDLRGAALSTPAKPAVVDLVNLLKGFFPTTVRFIDFTIFTQATATDAAVPRYTDSLDIPGTQSAASWYKAVQITISFRTETFGLFKFTFLDATSFNNFDLQTNRNWSTELNALVTYATADESFLSGRDGGRPDIFLQYATTLNEKLRRSYRMT